MTLANDGATVGWDKPTLAHAAEDEKLAKNGMRETDEERQDCGGEEEAVHKLRQR